MALQNLINLFSASSPLARFALLLTDSLLLIPYILPFQLAWQGIFDKRD
jgi:hypothetical protein